MIPSKDLSYWYYHFEHLLSGWTKEQQIQFHEYCIKRLRSSKKGNQK